MLQLQFQWHLEQSLKLRPRLRTLRRLHQYIFRGQPQPPLHFLIQTAIAIATGTATSTRMLICLEQVPLVTPCWKGDGLAPCRSRMGEAEERHLHLQAHAGAGRDKAKDSVRGAGPVAAARAAAVAAIARLRATAAGVAVAAYH